MKTIHPDKQMRKQQLRTSLISASDAKETSSAFSLLEVIGVLAVLAILACIIFVATTKSVDATVSRQESATLQAFADALQKSILRNRYIPAATGQSNWCQQIADQLGISSNDVAANLRNPRVFMIDPNLALGRPATSPPYWQNAAGSIMPTANCRVMILSSLGANLPASGNLSFNTLWNTPDGTLPSDGSFAGWSPDDLKIQRINLAPLFVNLLLTNMTAGTQPYYSIDGVASAVPASANAWFLQNTLVELLDESGLTNAPIILQRDCANYYVSHSWRDAPYPPTPVQTNAEAANLAQLMSANAIMFASGPFNSNVQTSTPPITVSLMTNFMAKYTTYANDASNPFAFTNAFSAQLMLQNGLMDLLNNLSQGQCTSP